jgi:hypothetical protein
VSISFGLKRKVSEIAAHEQLHYEFWKLRKGKRQVQAISTKSKGDKEMTNVKMTITHSQVIMCLLRDLRSQGYPLVKILEMVTYPSGDIEIDCEMNEPQKNEED